MSACCESTPRDENTPRLTCCGSPSVKGSLVATWNMIPLPWNKVKTASLPVWPWETSSPPLKLKGGEKSWPSDCLNPPTGCHSKKLKKCWFYPVKPCSWTVSPKIDRNSLNLSLSSLLLSMSSSVSYGKRKQVISHFCEVDHFKGHPSEKNVLPVPPFGTKLQTWNWGKLCVHRKLLSVLGPELWVNGWVGRMMCY